MLIAHQMRQINTVQDELEFPKPDDWLSLRPEQ